MNARLCMAGMALLLAGCGLFEGVPSFEEVRGDGVCGEPCGPCGVGAYACESATCEFESPWAGVVSESMACETIVVVSQTGNDENEGSVDAPVRSLERAIALGESRNARVVAMVEGGVWSETLRVSDGISVLGGLTRNLKASDERPIVASEDEGHVTGAELIGLRRPTTIAGLEVRAAGGLTNYGLRIVDSEAIELRDLVVRAGEGADGQEGEPGEAGARGEAGGNGGDPFTRVEGIGGFNSECPRANGGAGGRGGFVDGGIVAQSGENSPGGAQGGVRDGEDGLSGEHGALGAPGSLSGVVGGFFEVGSRGEAGEDGEAGIGGAGGAGGASLGGEGGGGAGGGAGGCGGRGGQGGAGGGSSIGLLIVDSGVRLTDLDVRSSSAGAGGRGGAGGAGGEGRRGGVGALGEGGGASGFDGGTGGAGGDGGTGGYGRGGSSYALMCENSDVVADGVATEHGLGGRDGLELENRGGSGFEQGCGLP